MTKAGKARGKFHKGGPSHIYVRMLRGEVTAERYAAVVRRYAKIVIASSLARNAP